MSQQNSREGTCTCTKLLARGEGRFAACLSWTATSSEHLPVCFTERIFLNHVASSACFGIEFIHTDTQLRRTDVRMYQWGKRLLLWPRRAPTVAVQGELGWLGVHCIRLPRLASLWARVIRLSGKCSAGRIADLAKNVQSSFIYAAANELVCMGVAHPATWGIGPCTASSVVKRWLRHVKTVVCQHSHVMCSATLRATESLALDAELQPWPHLHHIVYSRHLSSVSSRFWGLARCEHHYFSDGRAARHSNTRSVPCRFCACGPDLLSHALLECSAHAASRRRWRPQVGMNPVLCLQSLLNTRAGTNTARQIVHNVQFLATVCQAAEACEM